MKFSLRQYKNALIRCVEEGTPPKDGVRNIIQILIKHRQSKLLPALIRDLSHSTEDTTLPVIITAISKETANIAEDKLQKKKTPYRTIKIDSKQIGGISIQIGDTLIDNTIRTRLKALRNTITNEKRTY